MKNIIVSGAAGMIGTNLCELLLKKGNKVFGIDNFITGQPKNIKYLKKYKNFIFLKHDVIKPLPNSFVPKISHLEYIYDLACPTGVDNLIPLCQEMLLTCSLGTQNLLEVARKYKSKFLLTSSSEIYGDPEKSPQKESYTGNVDPIGIRSPYEEGKRFAESLTASYTRKYKIDAKIVRIFNTYGPYLSLEETRAVPRFLAQAIQDKPLTVKGSGKQTRTFCYVDDLIDGLVLVMQKGIRGEVYNLGNDKEIQIIDLAKLIMKVTGSKSYIKFIKRPNHDHKSRLPDLTKARKLGWKPNTSLKEGLVKTLEWCNTL